MADPAGGSYYIESLTASLAREVRDHEPASALFGGEEGYELYGSLIVQASERLEPGGLLVLELGYNSLAAVQPLLNAPTWSYVSVTNDLAGIPRVIAAERTGAMYERLLQRKTRRKPAAL